MENTSDMESLELRVELMEENLAALQSGPHELFSAVWQATLRILPAECPERIELAALAAWLAITAGNVERIVRETGRSKDWIYPRRAYLNTVLAPEPLSIDVFEVGKLHQVAAS